MTKIATGYVALKAEVDDLKRDLAKAEGKLEQSTRAMQGNANKTGKTFKKMWALYAIGATAAIAAGYKFLGMAKEYVQAYEEQRKAVAGVETALKSMGRYTPETSANLQQMAASLQQVTNYGDEATLQGTKFLLTYKGISDELLPRTIRAMQDLAALMGGGPQGLVRAANMLGKASMGMTGELRRVGITVDRATFEAEGYLGALKQIEQQVSGQAAAMADPWTQLSNVIGDTKEELGGLISIAFEDYAKDMIGLLGEMNEGFNTLNKRIVQTRRIFVESQIRMYEAALETNEVMMDMGGIGADFSIQLNPEDVEIYTQKLKELRQELNAITGRDGKGKAPGVPSAEIPEGEPGAMAERQKAMEEERKAQQEHIEAMALADAKAKEASKLAQIEHDLAMAEFRENQQEKELEAAIQAAIEKAEAVKEIQSWEAEDFWTRMQEKYEKLEAFREKDLISETEYQEALANLNRQSAHGMLQMWSKTFLALSQITGKHQKLMFRMYQAAAIAQATIAGTEAAVHAYKWGMATGGIPLAIAAAATSIAWTGAQIAAIAAQAPPTAPGATAVAEAGGGLAATTPGTEIERQGREEGARVIHVHFEGGVVADQNFMEDFAERLSEMVEGKEVRLVSSEVRAT